MRRATEGARGVKDKDVLGERGGGVWDPKVCAPTMARSDFPNGKFHVFPRWSLWSGGGGGGSYGCRPF